MSTMYDIINESSSEGEESAVSAAVFSKSPASTPKSSKTFEEFLLNTSLNPIVSTFSSSATKEHCGFKFPSGMDFDSSSESSSSANDVDSYKCDEISNQIDLSAFVGKPSSLAHKEFSIDSDVDSNGLRSLSPLSKAECNSKERYKNDEYQDENGMKPNLSIPFQREEKAIPLLGQCDIPDSIIPKTAAKYSKEYQIEGITWLWDKYCHSHGCILVSLKE